MLLLCYLLALKGYAWTTFEHKLYSENIIYRATWVGFGESNDLSLLSSSERVFQNFCTVRPLWPLGVACGSWSLGTLQDRWGSRDKLALGAESEGVDGKIYVPAVFHLDCFFHNLVFPTFTVKCWEPLSTPFILTAVQGTPLEVLIDTSNRGARMLMKNLAIKHPDASTENFKVVTVFSGDHFPQISNLLSLFTKIVHKRVSLIV